MNYVVGVLALFGTAFALFAFLSVTTRAMQWRMARIYWICAVVATGALFGMSVTSLILGWLASTSVLLAVLGVIRLGQQGNNVQPPHHNHSPH